MSASSEFVQLIEQWLEGTLGPGDFARFESCLREDAEARRHFRRVVNLDSALRDWACQDASLRTWLPQPPAGAPLAAEEGRTWRRRAAAWWWAAAAMVVALCCAGAFFWGVRRASRAEGLTAAKTEQTDLGCAILTQALGAQWAGDAAKARTGDTLNTGPISLTKGFAQIEFFSGATVLVEAPAELDLVSQWEVVCRHGKVRVRVPPAARGFRLSAPGVKLVDLGTEFGIDVPEGLPHARVHVFEGVVEAHPESGAKMTLNAGESIEQQGVIVARLKNGPPEDFVDTIRMQELGLERARIRLEAWRKFSSSLGSDPRLIAYYPMQQEPGLSRLVRNAAEPPDPSKNGGAVGAAWVVGRWPGKDALEFKHSGDRVRLRLEGVYQALTLACWVRVDALDRKYNALLLTDGYDPGAPHWQIYEDGRLMFSLTYPDPAHPGKNRNQIYYSPVLFSSATTGRWHHVAVTYENRSGEVIQYFDGREVSREISPFHEQDRPLKFGPCELGNWGLPLPGHKFPIRNLNGSLDEFAIYGAALSGDEVRAVYKGGAGVL